MQKDGLRPKSTTDAQGRQFFVVTGAPLVAKRRLRIARRAHVLDEAPPRSEQSSWLMRLIHTRRHITSIPRIYTCGSGEFPLSKFIGQRCCESRRWTTMFRCFMLVKTSREKALWHVPALPSALTAAIFCCGPAE